jgi:tetratricopeptide (TPR) repeat protein
MAARNLAERLRREVLSVVQVAGQWWKVVACGVALAVAVAAGLGAWWWFSSRREGEAGQAIAEVNQAFRRQYPKGFHLPGGEKEDPKPDGLIERYGQVAEKYPGTRAGAEARMRVGDLEYSAGRYDAAIRSYEQYAGDPRAPLRAAALLGKAYALLGKGDLGAAVAAFGAAAEAAPQDPLAAEAYLAQGRSLEALQKREEALRAYGVVTEKFPETGWAAQAKDRMVTLR